MIRGTICPPNEKGNDMHSDVQLIMQKWDECRKPLLKRIEEEKAGVFKRSQKLIRAVHVGSSAVQYRKVV